MWNGQHNFERIEPVNLLKRRERGSHHRTSDVVLTWSGQKGEVQWRWTAWPQLVWLGWRCHLLRSFSSRPSFVDVAISTASICLSIERKGEKSNRFWTFQFYLLVTWEWLISLNLLSREKEVVCRCSGAKRKPKANRQQKSIICLPQIIHKRKRG